MSSPIQAGLAGAVLSLNLYRAVVQSITYDEAWTYLKYVSQPWSTVFHSYEANHHVLYTILAKIACDLLGPSQIALRLPGVLAGLIFVVNAMRLSNLLIPRSPMTASLCFLAIVLNPLTLDFLSMARGYSLALAMLSCALIGAIGLLANGKPRRRQLLGFGSSLGLAVCANLTFLYSSLALFAAVVLLSAATGARLFRRLALWSALPAAVIMAAILPMPLAHATRGSFVFGQTTLVGSAMSLAAQSLNHDPVLPGVWTGETLIGVFYSVVGIAFIASGLGAVWLVRRVRRNRTDPALLGFLLAQISLDSILPMLVAAHHLAGLPYPDGRTGLSLVYLFTVMSIALMAIPWQRAGRIYVLTANAVLLLVAARFATQVSTTYYGPWRYDSSTKRIFAAVQQAARANPAGTVRVSSSWFYAPTLEFYRQVARDRNIAPIASADPMALSGFDFYVLSGDELSRPETAGLVRIFRDETSEATLAAFPQTPSRPMPGGSAQ